MWVIGFALGASVMLSLGCGSSHLAIPDQTIPHRVAEEVPRVVVWCRLPDGKMTKCEVRLLDGWWIAGPSVVEGTSGQ